MATYAGTRVGIARNNTGNELSRTARATGLLYLVFFITGIAGTLFVRSQLFASDDPAGTLSNLAEHESLARAGIALEMGIALSQALTAIWLYRLFRAVDTFAAGSLAAFGMVNAVAIMTSGALLATALDVAGDASLAAPGGAAATAQLLFVASDNVWGVAAMFFGLWLIPMGWLVMRCGWMPRLLGQVLVVGGLAYLASAFVAYLVPDSGAIADLMTLPATVGEVWITGYLLLAGFTARFAVRA